MIMQRQIKTLRLHATQPSLLQRGAILVEDALRTASLPGADGSRVLIVRRMSLGKISAGSAPSSVAMLMEQRFRQVGASAVHGDDPQAESAGAVYFRDEVEPYVALALRTALGKDTSAWFWRLAVRHWCSDMSREESLRWLLHAILRTAPGSLAVVLLVQTLLRARVLETLLSALEASDGAALLQAFGWPGHTGKVSNRILPDDHATASLGRSELQILKNFRVRWGVSDPRTYWLASILLAMARPTLYRSARLPRYASLLISLVQNREMPRDPEKLASTTALTTTSAKDKPKDCVKEDCVKEDCVKEEKSADPRNDGREGPTETLQQAAEELTEAVDELPHRISSRAGLFFLLTVMERVGLVQWLEENSERAGSNFPAQILRTLAKRLKTPANDPVWLALEEEEGDQLAPLATLVAVWLSRLRAYCRRSARIGLHSLICRRGRISVTPTHLDVYLPAGDADVRVRRAGLDLDLGWAPWLSRVVHFHYLSQGDFDV